MRERLDDLERRFDELSAQMARPDIAAAFVRYQDPAKEQYAIGEIVALYRPFTSTHPALHRARPLVQILTEPEPILQGAD